VRENSNPSDHIPIYLLRWMNFIDIAFKSGFDILDNPVLSVSTLHFTISEVPIQNFSALAPSPI
jgi:hypothetical protein